ncbi:MAG TPA: SPFH domain-containing protein, partial [bacterium]|nr:SPFH domain-containing protein [bacterium]
MVGFIIIILFMAFIALMILRNNPATAGAANAAVSGLRRFGLPLVGLLILLLLISQSVVVIQAGTAGVVKRLGAVRGEMAPGLHFILPFVDQVVLYPTVKKTYEASEIPEQSQADYPDIIISALTSDG